MLCCSMRVSEWSQVADVEVFSVFSVLSIVVVVVGSPEGARAVRRR